MLSVLVQDFWYECVTSLLDKSLNAELLAHKICIYSALGDTEKHLSEEVVQPYMSCQERTPLQVATESLQHLLLFVCLFILAILVRE